jgi:hypothetical protein
MIIDLLRDEFLTASPPAEKTAQAIMASRSFCSIVLAGNDRGRGQR